MDDNTLRADPAAEMALIGAVLMDPRAFNQVTTSPEDFHRPAHEELWQMIGEEIRAGRPVDPVAISQRVATRPIAGVDGAYLHRCVELAPARSTVPQYGEMVTNLAQLRRMAEAGAALIQQARSVAWDEAGSALDNGRKVLDEVVSRSVGIRVRTFADALEAAVDEWESPKVPAKPTGWSDLDAKLNGGWRPGQVTVLGARPAVGKSVVASCAAVAAATYGAGFFSLEMAETEVVARMAAAAQGIDLARLNSSALTDDDWSRLAKLADRSREWPLYIEDRSRLSMAQISATVRTWMHRQHLPLIIIDYSQLVTPADRTDSRERQVSRILEDCKHLAKEFNTHVLAVAQVNRESTKRGDGRPTMGDLRESGGIEAHADNIVLLHRDDEEMPGEIELIVAKNRHGTQGTVKLAWRPQFSSVNNMASGQTDYRFGMDK